MGILCFHLLDLATLYYCFWETKLPHMEGNYPQILKPHLNSRTLHQRDFSPSCQIGRNFESGSLPEGTMETELQQAGGRNTVYVTTCHAQCSSCLLRTQGTGRTDVHHPSPCWRPCQNDPEEPSRGNSLRERGVGVQEVLVRKMNFCRSLGGDLVNDSSPHLLISLATSV